MRDVETLGAWGSFWFFAVYGLPPPADGLGIVIKPGFNALFQGYACGAVAVDAIA